MTERRFTPDEANAELAELRERLPRLREARHALIAASERITEAVGVDGGGVEGSGWFRAQQALEAEVRWLAERGILLRDPETGLVDFPPSATGARCSSAGGWGRTTSRYFHEEHGGFGGRQAAVSDRPRRGRARGRPPRTRRPGIEAADADVELRYARDAAALAGGARRAPTRRSSGVRRARGSETRGRARTASAGSSRRPTASTR